MPRVVGFAIGAFCLGTLLLVSTLMSGYLAGSALGLITVPIWQFGQNVLLAMDIGDFVVPPVKCLAIGVAVALVCCATALARARRKLRAAAPGAARLRTVRARHPGRQRRVRPGGLRWHRLTHRSSRCTASRSRDAMQGRSTSISHIARWRWSSSATRAMRRASSIFAWAWSSPCAARSIASAGRGSARAIAKCSPTAA